MNRSQCIISLIRDMQEGAFGTSVEQTLAAGGHVVGAGLHSAEYPFHWAGSTAQTFPKTAALSTLGAAYLAHRHFKKKRQTRSANEYSGY